MKNYFKLATLFCLCSFLIGIAWGFRSQKKVVEVFTASSPLRLLCAENWLSPSTLAAFSAAHNVRIEQWTYATPSEFLKQMANADGKVDVICTSSLLLRSLVRSHWLKKMDFQSLPNSKLLSVDFTHLPYDPNSEYAAPLFWNLYGFFGRGPSPANMSWKQAWTAKKLSLWGDELNILQLMERLGLQVSSNVSAPDEDVKLKSKTSLRDEMRHMVQSVSQVLKPSLVPISAESMMAHVDWIEIPLARVARLLGQDSPYRFWLPEDGGTMELGVLAVGDKSTQSELAMQLINELLSTEQAMETHLRTDNGVVHTSLNGVTSVAEMQKPQALRRFELNRLQFPDLSVENLPQFQKAFDETVSKESSRGE